MSPKLLTPRHLISESFLKRLDPDSSSVEMINGNNTVGRDFNIIPSPKDYRYPEDTFGVLQ